MRSPFRFKNTVLALVAGLALGTAVSSSPLVGATTASGTVGRKAAVMKVVDAFAYESTSYFGGDPCIRLRLSAIALDHKSVDASLDFERELDRQLDGAEHVELEFSPSGEWSGGGAFYVREASCGWCQDGNQSAAAKTKVEAGVLRGTIKAKATDVEGGDGAVADLVLAVTVKRQTGITALPASGGDPGKAFVACSKAMATKDEATLIAACFAADDPWLVGQNLDYYNDDEFAAHAGQTYQALQLGSVKVSGGRTKGDQAEIEVQGTVVRRYGQDAPETTEKYKGKVYLRRVAGATGGWRFAGEELENDYE